MTDEIPERCIVDARAFVDAVAGVKADALGRDTRERFVDHLDVQVRALALLQIVERRIGEYVGHERIIDLQLESGVDDALVFDAHRGADGVQIIFFVAVMLVDADAARRNGGDERVGAGGAILFQRKFKIVEILLQRVEAAIGHRPDAHHRHHWRQRAAKHRAAEVRLVILGERLDLGGERFLSSARPRLEPGETLPHISEESGLRHLAVGKDVDAVIDLRADDVVDGATHRCVVGIGVDLARRQLRLHLIEKIDRARKAADVRRAYFSAGRVR